MNRKRFNATKHQTANRVVEGDQELATLEEARQFLRVSAKTVRRRIKNGELPGTKLGGAWRFSWAKLREIAGVAG